MKRIAKRWLWIVLLVLASVLVVGYLGYRELDRQSQQMLQSKLVRTSPATVVRKSGGRVYYQIDNFDNLPEPRRTQASVTESKRIKNGVVRSHDAEGWYDQVAIGSKVYVRYQCFSNGVLEIVGVDPKP
jgi:hypothetical protein